MKPSAVSFVLPVRCKQAKEERQTTMSQQLVRQVGSFTGSGHSDLLFYYPESGEWWLGSFSNQQLHWRLADNTAGFGNLLEGHKFRVMATGGLGASHRHA
jgi:hypothetical protein